MCLVLMFRLLLFVLAGFTYLLYGCNALCGGLVVVIEVGCLVLEAVGVAICLLCLFDGLGLVVTALLLVLFSFGWF